MRIVELAKEDIPISVRERYDESCPLFARIESPLVYQEYEALILDFLQHPYARAIHIRKNGGWERFLKSELRDQKQIDSMVMLAQLDPLRKDHFSLKFQIPQTKYQSEPAMVHFGEEPGILRVVKAFIPPGLEHLFHVERDTYFYSEIKAFAPRVGRRKVFEAERFSLAMR